VPHPQTGHPFRPEITTFECALTRKIVGFSFDVSENTIGVLAGVRMTCITHGVPTILYVDNGKGFKNTMMYAICEGVGCEIEHSLAMPIVCYYLPDADKYEVVDGFHRYSIMLKYPDIYEREAGCLPVVVIDKDLSNRMARLTATGRCPLPASWLTPWPSTGRSAGT
jgi:hypothetical protein